MTKKISSRFIAVEVEVPSVGREIRMLNVDHIVSVSSNEAALPADLPDDRLPDNELLTVLLSTGDTINIKANWQDLEEVLEDETPNGLIPGLTSK